MSRPWLTVIRQRSTARPSRSLAAPPRTLIEDTVLDLCAAASDEATVIGFLTLSIPRLTNSRRLARALERRSRIAHRRLIAEIIAETAIGVQSPLEFRWIKQVERPHRLPVPTRPYQAGMTRLSNHVLRQATSFACCVDAAMTANSLAAPTAAFECVRPLDIGRTDTLSPVTCRRRWRRRPRGRPGPCLRPPC
jgi:hypothetical protein